MIILSGKIINREEHYKQSLLFESENNKENFLIHFYENKKDKNYPFLCHILSEKELRKLKNLVDNALKELK